MPRPLLLAALLSALLTSTVLAAPARPQSPAAAGVLSSAEDALPDAGPDGPAAARLTWAALPARPHASYLHVPDGCQTRRCPLVVVTHPRGQSAERLRDSASMQPLLSALAGAGNAVLLSGDGGPLNWGSPASLVALGQTHRDASSRFPWNGRTYALGLSMGGLLALRSALPGSPYPVSGVALIDAWADLRMAWGTALSRREEISAAYGLQEAPPPELDPLTQAALAPAVPMWIVGSPEDQSVPFRSNAERLAALARPGPSEFVKVDGPHLGGNRFSPEMAERLVDFIARVELSAVSQANKAPAKAKSTKPSPAKAPAPKTSAVKAPPTKTPAAGAPPAPVPPKAPAPAPSPSVAVKL